jgi:predicted RNase H-like HicB family nuclease
MDHTVDRREITPGELATARRYAIVIEWSSEDDAYVVSVPDIPELHTHGATREEAAAMGDEAIAVWLAADQKVGLDPPPPRFSALGAFTSLSKKAERIRWIHHRLNVSQREFGDLLVEACARFARRRGGPARMMPQSCEAARSNEYRHGQDMTDIFWLTGSGIASKVWLRALPVGLLTS